MATVYKVHPAIGVARVGNSPDEWFVGPERVGERPIPADGFKDGQFRVKRQAARFRVFAHHDDGSTVEVTAADATIRWTVHLVNAKAAHPDRGNPEPAADLTIDPGPRTLDGPGQAAAFDTGVIRFAGQPAVTVPLGEARSDADGRLLVLGGAGTSQSPAGNPIEGFWATPGWYDDVADGPVTAELTLPDGSSPPVDGAWVLVAPPKFAPHQDSVVTLYDRLFDRMVTRGLAAAPTTTSYTRDVYPILRRAADSRWVASVGGAHSWTHPVTAQRTVDRIVARLRPSGDMPALAGDDSQLTAVQAAHLARWKAGTYTRDWAGEPAPALDVTPDGLDRAALEAAVGGAFFPGIEAGGLDDGQRPILEAPYRAAFRLDHTQVAPGAVTAAMALPWQADFQACGDSWWPVPRPNDVFADADADTQLRWDRDVSSGDEMAEYWHTLGFIVATDSGRHVETERGAPPAVLLSTPHLDFADVPAGPLGMVREEVLAIRFSVHVPLTLVLDPPVHPQLAALTRSVTVDPAQDPSAQFAVAYRTGVAPSALPTQVLTVRDPASGQAWEITVDANTVARPASATVLVVDRSASMGGDGRIEAVRRAAPAFAALLPAGDGLGVVAFDADAEVLQPVHELGDDDDAQRAAAIGVLTGAGLDPRGTTSIGDGVAAARGLVAGGSFGGTALVVLTDGVENQPRSLADVAAETTEPVYAVELGRPHSIGVPALTQLADTTGGALTTSAESDLDDAVLQIVADVSGAQVVTTTAGRLTGGQVARIPFRVTDADGGVDVIVRTAAPEHTDVRLQTPGGLLLEPWYAEREPAMRYGTAAGLAWFRIALPVALVRGRYEQGGTWHVLVADGEPRRSPTPVGGGAGGHAGHTGRAGTAPQADTSILRGLRAPGPRTLGANAHAASASDALAGSASDALAGSASAGSAAVAAPAADEGTAPARVPTPGVRSERARAFAVVNATTVASASAQRAFAAAPAPGVAYAVRVHAWSDVVLGAWVSQESNTPGTTVTVSAWVTQSGEALTEDPTLTAEITSPSGRTTAQALTSSEDGVRATFTAAEPGTYRIRVTALGRARNGQQFTRERTLTAATWAADTPVPSDG